MSLIRMSWRFLWGRSLVTILTIAGVALGAALISSVLTLRRETQRTFVAESGLVDLVVGAKGSPLQLVLSSLYHLDMPTGNIPYSRYEALKKDPRVTAAVALGLGDNYHGFRIVGTGPEYFELRDRESTGASAAHFHIAEGHVFAANFEAVIGSEVARQSHLKVGDKFVGSHGLVAIAGGEEHDEFPYHVVGILAAGGGSADRAIFTPLGSVWAIHDHEKAEHAALAGDTKETSSTTTGHGSYSFLRTGASTKRSNEREVTAVLVQLKTPGMRLWMAEEIKNQTESMAAIPINEMLRLYQQILAPIERALLAVAYLVVVVSALTVLTTLYQSAERRRRDMAILRTLGAHPRDIFILFLLEGVLLTLGGLVAGAVLGHLLVGFSGYFFRASTGLVVNGWSMDATEVHALLFVAAIGVVAGLLPGCIAYRRAPAVDLAAA
ncbi:ABC transporter permease [soil metagenome]